MNKITSKIFIFFILCISPLLAQEIPDYFDKNELAKITKVVFSYDSGWGENEFEFFIVYPFSDPEIEASIIVWHKSEFGKAMKWEEGDLIYIERENCKAYNFTRETWVKLGAL